MAIAQKDYSDYDRETWPIRILSDHRKHCLNHLQADTNSKKKNIENGVQYSVLLELPYFNMQWLTQCITYF